MKKLLSLVLALAMLLGCTAMAEAVDYTGVWALTGAEFAGVQMGPNMLAGMGLDMRMELAADGNVTLTTNGEVETGTWAATANGVAITDEVETLEFVYQDEMLLMEQQGAVLMLTREGAAPAIDDAAQTNAVLTGMDPLAFEGTWVLTGAEFAGVQMGPSALAAMGLDMRMELAADGNVTLTKSGEAETGTWAVTATGVAISDDTATLEFVYQDEMLLMEQQGAVMMLTREGAAPAVDEAAQSNVVLAGVDPLAFEGAWLLTGARAMGMEFTAEQMGVYIAFVLVGGEGIFGQNNAEGGIDQAPITYAVTEVEGEGTLLELIYTGENAAEPIVLLALYMVEDGRLYLQQEENGRLVDYYFTRQVEEAAE